MIGPKRDKGYSSKGRIKGLEEPLVRRVPS